MSVEGIVKGIFDKEITTGEFIVEMIAFVALISFLVGSHDGRVYVSEMDKEKEANPGPSRRCW